MIYEVRVTDHIWLARIIIRVFRGRYEHKFADSMIDDIVKEFSKIKDCIQHSEGGSNRPSREKKEMGVLNQLSSHLTSNKCKNGMVRASVGLPHHV